MIKFNVCFHCMLSADCIMNVNRDDDMSVDSVGKIVSWTDEGIRKEILTNIKDEYAADLLFHVLRMDPDDRLQSFDEVLDHPYFNVNARTQYADRVDKALAAVRTQLAVLEVVDRRNGLIARRTKELEGVSDKAFNQLWKTEKFHYSRSAACKTSRCFRTEQ